MKLAEPGTFAVLPSSSGYNVFCVGENHVPFVCEIRKLQGKTTWVMEPSTLQYASVAAVIDQLKAAGVAKVPLGIFAPTQNDTTSQYGTVMNEALNHSMSLTKALQEMTSLMQNEKEDEAGRKLAEDPRIGEFLLAAGCSLVS